MSECSDGWCTPGQCVVTTIHAVTVYLKQWRLTSIYFSLALIMIARASISRNKTVCDPLVVLQHTTENSLIIERTCRCYRYC